eukprot:3523989-Rhodomonas_salina.1
MDVFLAATRQRIDDEYSTQGVRRETYYAYSVVDGELPAPKVRTVTPPLPTLPSHRMHTHTPLQPTLTPPRPHTPPAGQPGRVRR